ncbi:DotU family type IV/VI secretion system protein [Pseudenhygromyxa sp. WMMC2535]|uniref:DotU family type IV/VI secretion system protein n=1 Tax=Pseudenhygromyxa sp. WMMC2535 TaxID=2712867 RepID=UPI001551AF1E|nr:DotU family type IV/VI secretion system protein [Pseudenhygromyxa sp. WMMC2535]NVB36779.1 DotU family type IV/VI secretion system protein [Pseudenhygromyxa sp. WMMC2535]
MERINEVTKDTFNALIQFRALDSSSAVSPQMPYQRLCGFIDQMLSYAREIGYEEIDVVDMAYAIVALADEVALHKGGPIRDFWMQRPLQLHYFNENLAGEGFFHRLNAVMSDPARVDILRVYYVCLLLGFQGQYAIRGGELELDAIIRRVKEALRNNLKDQPLSVQPLRPKEDMGRAGGIPAIWIALFFLLFSLGLLIALRIGLNSQSENVVERMAPMMKADGEG